MRETPSGRPQFHPQRPEFISSPRYLGIADPSVPSDHGATPDGTTRQAELLSVTENKKGAVGRGGRYRQAVAGVLSEMAEGRTTLIEAT